ncbi:MAG: hypothetical protein ACJ748_16895, partial [Flavisolibacter sp.]
MNNKIFIDIILTALLISFSNLSFSQNKIIDSTSDQTYGNGMKLTKIYTDSIPYQPNVNRIIIIELYDGSQPRKLMERTDTTSLKDGKTIITHAIYRPDRWINITQITFDALKNEIAHEERLVAPIRKTYSGKKWEIDQDGIKQEYTYDNNDNIWVNYKDKPSGTRETTEDNTYGKGKKITENIKNI